MTIFEVAQGTCRNLDGRSAAEVVADLEQVDADFLTRNPSCAKWHRPSFRKLEVSEGKTAPWGYVWYQIDDNDMLRWHSAQLDSSG